MILIAFQVFPIEGFETYSSLREFMNERDLSPCEFSSWYDYQLHHLSELRDKEIEMDFLDRIQEELVYLNGERDFSAYGTEKHVFIKDWLIENVDSMIEEAFQVQNEIIRMRSKDEYFAQYSHRGVRSKITKMG